MYPSSSLLGQNKDAKLGLILIDKLIDKVDGFVRVFLGAH